MVHYFRRVPTYSPARQRPNLGVQIEPCVGQPSGVGLAEAVRA
jgi:hypothetical protein